MFFAVILACLTAAFCLATVAMAQGPSPDAPADNQPEIPYEWIHTVWAAAKATPIGILIALATSLAGYLSKTPEEKFKLENFAFTAIISFLIGLLTVYGGWSYAQIEIWLANGFLTWYIWKVAKIIIKKFGWRKELTAATGLGPPTQA